MSPNTAHPATAAERSAILCRDEATAEFRAGDLEGGTYTVSPAFETASVARLDLNGRRGRVRATGSRIYYVLGGQGTFEVEGASLDIQDGDAVHVRPGQTYDFEGELALLCVCVPAAEIKEEPAAD
jgi:mannose-6-phosphate isomerase-like protein (cupin superfamily)